MPTHRCKHPRSIFRYPNLQSARYGGLRAGALVAFIGVPEYTREYMFRELALPESGWVCYASVIFNPNTRVFDIQEEFFEEV